MPEDQQPAVTVTQAGPFALMLDDDFSEDFLDVADVPDTLSFDDDFDDVDDDDVDADDDTAARIAKLEEAARSLAAAEVARQNRRVKRKVAASTTGAGASGFIPLLLSLCGVYHLDPEITAALSTLASLIGAFAAGWITPERAPAVTAESMP